ncbi:MAG: site-2 protease family protein [Deltaproteobacteria bacterium]
MSIQRGSLRLFRFAGVDVFLHWSWFVVAVFEIQYRAKDYAAVQWNILEYLALFVIVLMHEYGHALACKQVGGTANRIMLWPLGGVAYVMPPQRPGAVLWSIAAGPLVNVVLAGLLFAAGITHVLTGGAARTPDAYHFLVVLLGINLLLLVFNLLPIYPLDGGQILRALLWFPFGRINSLMIATIIGLVGGAGLVLVAVVMQSIWIGIVAVFMLMSCWRGLQQSLTLSRVSKAPRRTGFACPECKKSPPTGNYWVCSKCRTPFDTFQAQGTCPTCHNRFATTMCVECGALHPMSEWVVPGTLAPAPAVPSA